MLRITLAAVALALLPLTAFAQSTYESHYYSRATTTSTVSSLNLYATEQAAQKQCPRDTVVSVNAKTDISHRSGERLFHRIRQGAYVCVEESGRAGDRETENG